MLKVLFKIIFLIFMTLSIIIPENDYKINNNKSHIKNELSEVNTSIDNIMNRGIIGEIKSAKIKTSNINRQLLSKLSYEVISDKREDKDLIEDNIYFGSGLDYSNIDGVTTFRGNNYRNGGSFGYADLIDKKLEIIWSVNIGSIDTWTGVGWNGQPAIVKWSDEIKEIMNINSQKKNKDNLKEVIYATLDGNIYFLDLDDGKDTRNPIRVPGPIKGSVAVDPRGIPLLYSGQGINVVNNNRVEIGYRIFSLIDGKKLHFINGLDPHAFRGWGAFDSNPLINKEDDTLLIAGENGILYKVKLNTNFNIDDESLEISPNINKYRYKIEGNNYQGIENSLAVYKNIGYFADNGGWIQAVDLNNLQPVWVLDVNDDTDSTIVIEEDDDKNVSLFTASEVDKQGERGISYIRRIDGLSGEVVWKREYICQSKIGKNPNNGGALATPVLGKNNLKDLVIFNLARHGGFNKGSLIALDKKDGREVWKFDMDNYSWSSPVAVYNKSGEGYIIVSNSIGEMYLLEGLTGKVLDVIYLGSNVEGSPSVYNDIIVVGTRGQKIYGVKIK